MIQHVETMIEPMAHHPEVLNEAITPNCVEITLRIPANLHYLEGHFPNFPVVPGIVQLHWAVEFAKQHYGQSEPINQVSQLKCSNILRPLDVCTLSLNYDREKNAISFLYMDGGKKFSSGRLHYGSQNDI